MTAHLGYDRHGRERPAGAGNYRNGTIAKTMQTGVGPVPLAVLAHRAPVPPAVRHVPQQIRAQALSQADADAAELEPPSS
jgi:hypothetical protein